jgi:aldehyde:ferredoxin oxidoreductase
VFVGRTHYTFRSPVTGRYMNNARGERFVVDMAKVPWR